MNKLDLYLTVLFMANLNIFKFAKFLFCLMFAYWLSIHTGLLQSYTQMRELIYDTFSFRYHKGEKKITS